METDSEQSTSPCTMCRGWGHSLGFLGKLEMFKCRACGWHFSVPNTEADAEPVKTKLENTYKWRKVEAPVPWRPKDPGDELAGFYGGKTSRQGSYGQYEVALIHVPLRRTFMVSGVRAIQLVDAAGIDIGWPIRIVWKGSTNLGGNKTMKNFEVLVAEGNPLAPDEMPMFKKEA